MKFSCALMTAVLATTLATAQTPIVSVNTSYYKVSSGAVTYTANGAPSSTQAGETFKYKFGTAAGYSTTDLRLNTFGAGTSTYKYLNTGSVEVRMCRADNMWVQGKRELKFEEGEKINDQVRARTAYNDAMESFFKGCDRFNAGTDNLFANDPSGNSDANVNNIERVDVLFTGGYKPGDVSKTGFAVFERGAAGQHDPFSVALVLSVDATGKPTSYSKILDVDYKNYGTINPLDALSYVISRRDVATESRLKYSTSGTQGIGGVYFRFSDFNVPQGTMIYGYSILPDDFTGTKPADAVDYANTTFFPRTTSNATGVGGLDMISVTGVAVDVTMPLAVGLNSFEVQTAAGSAGLSWKVSNAQDARSYIVERSVDGNDWKELGDVTASAEETQYNWYDRTPLGGTNYYRIRIEEHNGVVFYSPVRTARFEETVALSLAPNPARGAVRVTLQGAGQVQVYLSDASGRVLRNTTFAGASDMLSLEGLPAGVYIVTAVSGSQRFSQRLSIQ